MTDPDPRGGPAPPPGADAAVLPASRLVKPRVRRPREKHRPERFRVPEAAAIAAAWERALDLWSANVTLSPPTRWRPDPAAPPGQGEPLAYIDMVTRQVVVNLEELASVGASHALRAVLAHEVGHHIRFPHTLGFAASLELLEKRLIPGLGQSLTNLFFDLQVNEVVGRTWAEELADVYRGFAKKPDAKPDALFVFYLSVYEELWGLEAGDLSSATSCRKAEKKYPGLRAEARIFAQTFWALDDPTLQFVYFCSIVQRYIEGDGKGAGVPPLGADVPRPGLDDYAGALYGGAAIERALAEAKARGWIEEGDGERGVGDALADIARVSAGRPGNEAREFQQALVGRHYKRLVDEHIFEVPPATTGPAPDAFLPTTVTEWEPGDDVRSIDWTQSVLLSGELAGVRPMRRELLPDEPHGEGTGLPAVEIYLDTSGSMPSPLAAVNAMTLAAQILSAAAIRKGGKVRGVVYSSGPPLVSPWMADEETARNFLLNYAGGGTDYPFALLRAHTDGRPEAVRVIVSDADFLSNMRGKAAPAALAHAVERSARVVVLLAVPWAKPGAVEKTFAPFIGRDGFRLAVVNGYADLGGAARDLARALFGGATGGPR